VLGGIAKFIDCEEQVVSSAIRLESGKQPSDICGESFAAAPYATFEVVSGFTEGEMNVFNRGVNGPSESSNSDCSKFEGGSKILNSMYCPLCKAAWERFTEFDLMVFMDSVRIRINKGGVVFA
jgi:hypothetical protein